MKKTIHAWANSLTKKDFWTSFIGIIFGFGIGVQLVSFMVPDASMWAHLFAEEKKLFADDKKNHASGKPMHNMEADAKVVNERTFLEAMITHHQGAIAMSRQVISLKPSQKVVDLAQQMIITQEKEIKMMKEWGQETSSKTESK